MKVLWITNILFDHHKELMGVDSNRVTGGAWLNAAYDSSLSNKEIELHIATVNNVSSKLCGESKGNKFYILPDGGDVLYDINSSANRLSWDTLRDEVKPDLVVVWGTESRHAYLAMTSFYEKNIPIVIFVQGIMKSIVAHYNEGVPFSYQYRSLRDFYDLVSKKSNINIYKAQVPLEEKMFKMAAGAVIENDWAENVCRSINPNLLFFRNPLPIRKCFYDADWNIDNIKRHTIFTNAGGYPIKGHHILFQALAKVKEAYPDVKCYIPGTPMTIYNTFIRKSGYFKLLYHLIEKGKLYENIEFLGNLTSEQMVKQIEGCNVYVMPSIVENHSSSLIEAMIAGAPCLSSLCGGTASLITPSVNGVLYNSLDADSLAGSIIDLFNNDDKAVSLSKKSREIVNTRSSDFGDRMCEIYKHVLYAK